MLDHGEARSEDEKPSDLPLFAEDDERGPAVEAPDVREGDTARKGLEPFPPFPPRTEPERRDEEEPEVKVPDFLLAERRRETYVETRTSPTDTSLFADEPRLDAREGEQQIVAGFDDAREPQPESAPAREPEPVAAEEPAPVREEPVEDKAVETPRSDATVVGTYNSGDNTYVMFSDGSIEAQTPAGVFRFQSLDELKAFIASGGEGGGAGPT